MKRWLKLEKEILKHLLEQYIGYYLGVKYYPSCHVHFENIHGLLIINMNRTGGFSKKQQSSNWILFGNLSGFSFPFFYIDKYH